MKKTSFARGKIYALIATKDIVALPGLALPIYIGSGVNADAVNFALKNGEELILALDRSPSNSAPSKSDIAAVGTLVRIAQSVRLSNGDLKLRLNVQRRVKISMFVAEKPFAKVRITPVVEPKAMKLAPSTEKLLETVKEKFSVLGQYDPALEDHILAAGDLFDPGELADLVSSILPLNPVESQAVLEEFQPEKRLRLTAELLNSHIDSVAIKDRVASRAQHELGKMQHQELLREQIRQIQEELGEAVSAEDELNELGQQLKKLKMPLEAKKEAQKQFRRLEQLHPDTSEAALARTYIDWILDVPWSKRTKDRIDLEKAREILEADHYGLEKAKERILDFLGVSKLRKEIKGPILLFVGPPGVGKTSLGRSIAKALGREFVRVALGGLRDEAELRGHRRTYVGALPGRIIQGLSSAKVKNPVFMLDEIDKIGSDFRGDPASVLLEILDPEQNKAFEDHFLNIPFDLSEVMFIATANVTDTIPSALLDRMEVIEIAGYTNEEKLQIAKRYLVPKEREANGLKGVRATLPDQSIDYLVDCYTRESGVRELGRNIGTVFRKVARLLAEEKKAPKEIALREVETFLGPVKYVPDRRLAKDEVGIVMGLAWTPVGGEVMPVEAAITPGKGSLSLTGQLGEVMKESAMAALTYVLSNAEQLGIDPAFYERSQVHIHVPQGAIQKDGPSAGVAMVTALVSVLSNVPVSRNVAMTGEITLRGTVLAIGGLREKALAALRIGASTVVIPKENERELVEFPDYLREKIEFRAVEHVEEVLEIALEQSSKERRARREIAPRARPTTT